MRHGLFRLAQPDSCVLQCVASANVSWRLDTYQLASPVVCAAPGSHCLQLFRSHDPSASHTVPSRRTFREQALFVVLFERVQFGRLNKRGAHGASQLQYRPPRFLFVKRSAALNAAILWQSLYTVRRYSSRSVSLCSGCVQHRHASVDVRRRRPARCGASSVASIDVILLRGPSWPPATLIE